MEEDNELIRVSAVKISGLFGIYDHLVPLNASERITIIHGPNGVGKTVFLKLTHALISGRYSEFARIPFKSFEMLFNDGSKAELIKELHGQRGKETAALRLIFTNTAGPPESTLLEGDALNPTALATQISDMVPYLVQTGPNEWMDRRTDEAIDANEAVSRFGDLVPEKFKKKLTLKEPKALKQVRERAKAHFIEAQRLIRLNPNAEWRFRQSSSERAVTETVQEYSKDLKRKIDSTLTAYAKQSQKLDQTFPQRLIEAVMPTAPLDRLKEQMSEIDAERSRLSRIGLLDIDNTQEVYPFQTSQLDNLQTAQISVMAVYAGDTKEKLSVLKDIALRIELLLSIVNRKFKNKEIRVARDTGLVAFGTFDKQRLPLTSLSSGEQHELVLLYDLLFKVQPNTLVLIDEPELSLHVTWQENFLNDLREIIRISKFDVLLATHSPYIVGDRSDLMIILSPTITDSLQ